MSKRNMGRGGRLGQDLFYGERLGSTVSYRFLDDDRPHRGKLVWFDPYTIGVESQSGTLSQSKVRLIYKQALAEVF